MDRREKLFQRVREDAANIVRLSEGGTNVPIDQYIDTASLYGLCDSLGLEPENWQAEDLERILLIRDGLYSIRHNLRDAGDDAEHSVDQLLSALDRLYADLEFAFREFKAPELLDAQRQIAALQRGPQIAASEVPKTVGSIKEQANELLVKSHTTVRRIELTLVKIDRSGINIEVLRNAKLMVQRLSASVFAIKLSLEQRVIFGGIFKFLNDSADRIVSEMKDWIGKLNESYQTTLEFLSDLRGVAETGGRFTRQVGEFLQSLFDDDLLNERQIKFKAQTHVQGDAILCGTTLGNVIALGGRKGTITYIDASSTRTLDQYAPVRDDILSIGLTQDGRIALGTDAGLALISPKGRDRNPQYSSFREKVASLASPEWNYSPVVTGSREGMMRQWTITGRVHIAQGGAQTDQNVVRKVGRSVQKVLQYESGLLVAAGEEILLVDEALETRKRIPVQFRITDLVLFADATLIACGSGQLVHVNLSRGDYTRILSAGTGDSYVAIAKLNNEVFCVGTEEGKISAFDFASGEVLGETKVDFPLRGILPLKQRILAYGGGWNSKSRSATLLTWEQLISDAPTS